MDEDDSDSLDKLAADIADGGSIDWEGEWVWGLTAGWLWGRNNNP